MPLRSLAGKLNRDDVLQCRVSYFRSADADQGRRLSETVEALRSGKA